MTRFVSHARIYGMTATGAPAKGTRRSQYRRVIAVGFDEETFATIRARAAKERTSFAEQVRLLVEWGLMEEKSR